MIDTKAVPETLRRAIDALRAGAKTHQPGSREARALNAMADWLESVLDLHEPILGFPGRETNYELAGCQWCNDEDWPCADTRFAVAAARIHLEEDSR